MDWTISLFLRGKEMSQGQMLQTFNIHRQLQILPQHRLGSSGIIQSLPANSFHTPGLSNHVPKVETEAGPA